MPDHDSYAANRLRRERGYAAERKLVLLLHRKGYRVWRVPVSGARSSRVCRSALPDVFAVNKRKNLLVAFECKSTSKSSVLVDKGQVKKLLLFLDGFPSSVQKLAVVSCWFHKSKVWVMKTVEGAEAVRLEQGEESTWRP